MNYMVLATSVKDIKDGIDEAMGSGRGYDYIRMIQSVGDIRRVISFLYGFLVVLIEILVPLIVSIELIYICFPMIRTQMEKLAVKVENLGFASKTIGFTLRDARTAVERSETVQTGKSPLTIYLKLKCTSLMMVMFIIAVVATGAEGFVGFVRSLIDKAISIIFY